MKSRFSVVFVLALLTISIPKQAEAQFWKKLFKKRKHQQEENNTKKAAVTTHETPKKKDFAYPQTRMKSHYRIDVLVPLYLNEVVQDNTTGAIEKVPEKASAGVEFYKGIKLAADSLNKMHHHIDIYVHDIADTFRTLDFLVNTHEFDASDLIIGSVPSHDIPTIADYAAKNHVNFVSAFSPSDGGISFNPYFTLLQPSLQGHCEWIRENLEKHYPKKKLLLFYRDETSLDRSAYEYLMKDGKSISFQKLQVDKEPDVAKLKTLFDSTQTNVIVMPIIDHAYAEMLIKGFGRDFPGYQFEVYGMPSWKGMSSLRSKDAYPNVRVNISEPFYFDYTSKHARYVERMYRKEFGGKAGELVYRGYEALFWYADILKKYGTIFNPKMSDNSGAPFTKFKVKPKLDKNRDILYNENQQLYLYRYQKGTLHVEQ